MIKSRKQSDSGWYKTPSGRSISARLLYLLTVAVRVKRLNSSEFFNHAVEKFVDGYFDIAYRSLANELYDNPDNIDAWSLMAKVWSNFEYDSKERVMAYCYRKILDIDGDFEPALNAIQLLEPQYLDDNEANRAESDGTVAELKKEIRRSPRIGDLHFDLASLILTTEPIFRGVGEKGSDLWRNNETDLTSFAHETVFSNRLLQPLGAVVDLGEFNSFMSEAREHLNLALALGLTDLLNQAKARFLLFLLNACKARKVPNKAIKDDSGNKALVSDVISDTIKYLRRYPHHVEALNIQREAYKLLGKRVGEGRAEHALKQALLLEGTGLSADSSEVKPGRVMATGDRPGKALEKKVQMLIQSMGLRAVAAEGSADGGIDVIAYSDHPIYGGKYVVQCKDWENPVGVSVVRDLYGVVMSENANKGILITTGKFSIAAEQFAQGKQLDLIEGTQFEAILRKYGQ